MTEVPKQFYNSDSEVPFHPDTFFFNNRHSLDMAAIVFNGTIPEKYQIAIYQLTGKEPLINSQVPVSLLIEKTNESPEKAHAILKAFSSELSQVSIDGMLEMAENFRDLGKKDKVVTYVNNLNNYLNKYGPQVKALKNYLAGTQAKLAEYQGSGNELITGQLQNLAKLINLHSSYLDNQQVLERVRALENYGSSGD